LSGVAQLEKTAAILSKVDWRAKIAWNTDHTMLWIDVNIIVGLRYRKFHIAEGV